MTAAAKDPRDVGRTREGKSPFAAVLSCADSSYPVETLFDVQPGEIFVCRKSSSVQTMGLFRSLESCVTSAHPKLVLVLGHSRCGALKGAGTFALYTTSSSAAPRERSENAPAMAVETLQKDSANSSVKTNVMHTVEFLLQYSEPIREAVRGGSLQVHGAVCDLDTGEVEFIGASTNLKKILNPEVPKPAQQENLIAQLLMRGANPSLAQCEKEGSDVPRVPVA